MVFDAGSDAVADAVPCPNTAGETSAAVPEPIGHRGEVNWLDAMRPGPAFAPEPQRPEGPFMVINSVGRTFDERFGAAKAMDSVFGVERVRVSMDGVKGLRSHQSFSIQQSLGDAITITFWRDDAARRAYAYRPGEHKFQLDRYRELETADRPSSTRLATPDRRGTWRGGNPFAR